MRYFIAQHAELLNRRTQSARVRVTLGLQLDWNRVVRLARDGERPLRLSAGIEHQVLEAAAVRTTARIGAGTRNQA